MAAEDEADWHRVAMQPIVNDRWEASFKPARIGRHRFTVQAWWDAWETFRHDLSAKHAAGQPVNLEIEEGCHMIEAAASLCRRLPHGSIRRTLVGQIALLLAEETAEAMHAADERPFATEFTPAVPLDVDRPQAGFASWYKMFPAPPRMTRRGTAPSAM